MRDSRLQGCLPCFVTAVAGVLAEANADAGAEGCPGASAGGERAPGAAGCGTAAGMNPAEALVLSQVVLSFGIPFALAPLVLLTCRHDVTGTQVNRRVTTIFAWSCAVMIIGMNIFPDLPAALPQLRHPRCPRRPRRRQSDHPRRLDTLRLHPARAPPQRPRPRHETQARPPDPGMAGLFGSCAPAVTAGLADSWIPSPGSVPTGEIPAVRRRTGAAAEAAGRRPGEIRGILNVSIRIDPDAEPQPRDHRFGQARGKPAMGPPRPRLHRIQLHYQRPRPES